MADQTPVSPVGANKPELTVSAPTIEVNTEPVELDGTPTSPEALKHRRESKADHLAHMSPKEKQERDHAIESRKNDAAVVVGAFFRTANSNTNTLVQVDVDTAPGAEEFSKSEDAGAKVSGTTQ